MTQMETAVIAARDIFPMFVAQEIENQIFNAWEGSAADLIESRSLFRLAERIMSRENIEKGSEFLRTLDLEAIAAEGVADRTDEGGAE